MRRTDDAATLLAADTERVGDRAAVVAAAAARSELGRRVDALAAAERFAGGAEPIVSSTRPDGRRTSPAMRAQRERDDDAVVLD